MKTVHLLTFVISSFEKLILAIYLCVSTKNVFICLTLSFIFGYMVLFTLVISY